MDQYFGSASYSTNPYVQLYNKIVQEQKQEAATKYTSWRRKFDSLTTELMREAGIPNWKLGIGSLIGGVNRHNLFKFAYKDYKSGDVVKTRFVTPSDPEWATQVDTEAKRKMMHFVLESVDQFFINSKST
jgi:hypothetical protein